MTNLVPQRLDIKPMTPDAIARVGELEKLVLSCPQIEIHTHHVLHAGLYARTITIPAGVVLTGALIKRSTLLVVCGDVVVSRGDDDGVRITGAAVIPASAGRKQAFVTYADTTVTMTFPTQASTIEQAEAEFTDDTDLLMSRRDPEHNTIIITGE
ncbi:hypothetical protein LMG18090_04049 [Ralstonia mannitolilytica]|uniref:hypothetical protein n=1 Tax=Ralstonia mannitolilytica TaxID=105219 RepID=UPI0007B0179A|nr:hypothetical protein [Ralstonia mannitolilytica]ANA34470.1 hypothetical protein VZ52_14325 [Ralstonia mannitolilytica]CAJ0800808.1 hypothetical protein LMG18090_04049 [Ralstonia mannitolilytica]